MNSIMRRALRLLGHVTQWMVFVFITLVCLALAAGVSKYLNKDIDVSIYVASIVALALVAVGLLPPLLFRLPGKGRVAAYALGLLAFVTALWALGDVLQAYQRTPEGAQEAKATAAATAARMELERQQDELARQEEERQAASVKIEKLERDVAALHRNVERCINWQGQIPALVRYVKQTLHNPRSFEHVRTEMKTAGAFPAVVMEYRAENGFGAIRTQAVSAFITPSDCSVRAAKEYEASDFSLEQ